MINKIFIPVVSGFLLLTLFSCSNPLGGDPAADSDYQPGALVDPETPTPTPPTPPVVPAPVVHPAPTITSVSPLVGITSGGETMHIQGTGFRAGLQVKVGGVDCSAVTLQSPTQVDCVVPSAVGISVADVYVENSDNKSAQLSAAWSYIGNPRVWLRAEEITGLNSGDLIATWKDSSSHGNDFIQANPANQPQWISNQLNGRPVVHFSGGPRMESTFNIGISGASDRSLFIVAKKTTASAKNIFGWGNNATNSIFDFMNYSGAMMVHFYVNDTLSVSPAFTPNVWSLLGADVDSTGVRISIDGVNSAKQSIVLTTADSKARIGAGTYASYDGYDGDIAEALLLPQKLSAGEQTIVTCYFSRKYNLNLALCP